jgi:predicted acyl esterase
MNSGEISMRRWTLAAAACALLAAALWHLPAIAQRVAMPAAAPPAAAATAAATPMATPPAVRPAAPQLITFDAYRDFRMRYIGQRQERLTEELAAANLSAAEKAGLEQRKAYYDRLAAMPAAQRDAIFRARFDQIDTNHDGTIDAQERAAWRENQRERYRQAEAERAPSPADQR